MRSPTTASRSTPIARNRRTRQVVAKYCGTPSTWRRPATRGWSCEAHASAKEASMCRVMVTWLAIGLALGLISQAQADDGDPWTPGQDKPGTSISVESNDDGVTIYISFEQSSPGSSSDPSSGNTGGDPGGWSCTSHPMSIGNATRDWFERESTP